MIIDVCLLVLYGRKNIDGWIDIYEGGETGCSFWKFFFSDGKWV